MSQSRPDPTSGHIQIHNPEALSDPKPYAYSHEAVVAPGSRLVYLSGQVGFSKTNQVSSDFATQARQAFANVNTCLAEVGASTRNIVSLTAYVVDYDGKTSPLWDLLKEWLTDDNGPYYPPSAVIPVPALVTPELKLEIQCVAALPSTPSPVTRVNEANVPYVDVVVVGAGLSGLQAATDIHKSKVSYVVLEAKDRVGGKTQAVNMDHGPGVLDIGGAWINDTTQPKMYALFQKFGFEALPQRVQGDEVFRYNSSSASSRTTWPGLPAVGAEQQGLFDKVAAELDKDSKSINLQDASANTHIEDISLGEYFRQKGAYGFSFDLWRAWIRALTGTEPDAISLVYFLDYIKSAGGIQSLLSDGDDGAQYMTNRSGNQTISKRLAAALNPGSVRLNSPVNRITQSGDFTLVETLAGLRFKCRKVLISIPTPLYRHIQFSPSLPADKQEYANSAHLGPYSKCILIYSQPWWREAGLNGSFIDLEGPVTFSRDVSSDKDGLYAISCLIFGEYATEWMRHPVSRRIKVVKDQLASMLDNDLKAKVYDTIQEIEQHWAKEPYIEGVPCPMPAPGGIWQRLGNSLRRPFGNLHFAGTETAYEWKGYMEGAVLAGERGAAEVVAALRAREGKSRVKL